MVEPVSKAVVIGHYGHARKQRRAVYIGDELTFGRGDTATMCFPSESRLSRLAGVIRALPDGVVVTNLSTTHDLNVRARDDTIRLATSVAGRPVAGVLLTAGVSQVTWPGATAGSLEISVHANPETATQSEAVVVGRTTERPVILNRYTKEFAVALLLCRTRLATSVGVMAAPTVPDLTRQVLEATNSQGILHRLRTDPETRRRTVARTHEHLKSLRDKLLRAGLVDAGTRLSTDGIADLLVTHGVLAREDLTLLDNPQWLAEQRIRWER